MGLIRRLATDAVRGRKNSREAQQEAYRTRFHVSPLCSNFENVFSQVMPLVDEMVAVQPFGVGRNGAKLSMTRTPELAVLQNPNKEMGYYEFVSTMFSTWLTERWLLVHVHRDDRGRIYGYSVLPPTARKTLNNEVYFEFMNGNSLERLYDDEVMTLRYARSPRVIDDGISPAVAAELWAQLDDLVAQYQKAYFENGAVPATITFITASTQDKYIAKRRELEGGLKGARNRNKTVYAWRQMLDDGSTGDEIEVKPIQGNNSTLAIRELNDIIIDRMNKVYGTSNFIQGDDASAKYDNAELSDHQFTKRRVYPALLKFWGQFQHELDRITGGLGYAISFEIEIPELTDRAKTLAEIEKIKAETEAIKLANLKAKKDLISSTVASAKPKQLNAKAKVAKVLLDAYNPEWGKGEEEIKRIYNLLVIVARSYVEENPEYDYDEICRQIEATIREEAKSGALDGAKGLLKVGFDKPTAETALRNILESSETPLSQQLLDNLDSRTLEVVNRYNRETGVLIKETILEAELENLTQREIKKRLEEKLPTARAELIARNETHHAINAGRLALDQKMADEYGLKVGLKWHALPGACDLCAEMNGQIVEVGKAFPDHVHTTNSKGELVQFDWHSVYNDYGRTPNAHPNCRCTFDEVVEVAE